MVRKGRKNLNMKAKSSLLWFILLLIIIVVGAAAYILPNSHKWSPEFKEIKKSCTPLYYCLALIENNPSLCDKEPVIGTSSPENCYDDYYIRKAVMNNDANACSNIKADDKKILCNAIISNNENSCNEITNSRLKLMCIAAISKKSDMCSQLTQEGEINECQDSVYYFDALKTKNVELCQKLSFGGEDRRCEAIVSGNTAFCNEVEIQTCMNYRLIILANKKADGRLCNEIKGNDTIRAQCMDDVTYIKLNPDR